MGFLNKIIDKTGAYFWKINSDGSADVTIKNSEPIPMQFSWSSPVVKADKVTNADATDRSIVTTGFERISIICDGPAELRVCIDGDSTELTNNIIYIKDGEEFAESIAGTVVHYSIANDSCEFRYLLR